MDQNTDDCDNLERTNGDRKIGDADEVKKPQNSCGVINECNDSRDLYNDICNQSHSEFAYVPFNSPQDGYSQTVQSRHHIEGNTVLDEVSRTLASLYCDDKLGEKNLKNGERKMVESDNISLNEKFKHTNSETDIPAQDEISCMEGSHCAENLPQSEISEHYIQQIKDLRCESSQQFTIPSHQIKFACTLELMPTYLPNTSHEKTNNKSCSSELSQTVQKSPSPCTHQGLENCSDLSENSPDDPVSDDILEDDCSQIHSQLPLETELNDDYTHFENVKTNVSQSSHQIEIITHVNDDIADDCYISIKSKVHTATEISAMNQTQSLSNDNDCNLMKTFDKQLIADVKITIDSLLENCSNVFGQDDENANTSINQYKAKQSVSVVNRLDMRAENESGLYSEYTSLGEYLKAGSGHANSSTINEANTSDLMVIGEPSTDCRDPMAMLCHDNKQQEIGKSHENVAASAMHSSENDICGGGQCIEASLELMDSSPQIIQVRKNLCQNENMASGTLASSQASFSDNRLLKHDHDLHAEGFELKDDYILRNFPLKKDDLISEGDACSDEIEMQVPEISLQEALLSSTGMSVSDFQSNIAMIEETTIRKEENCTEDNALVSRQEDIYTGETKSGQAYTRPEEFEKFCETADRNAGDIDPWDQCTKLEDFHKENVHSAEDVKCESKILPVKTNDDISHLSSSSKALNPNTCKDILTIHTKMNANLMDLHGTGSPELLAEDVSESKNTVNSAHMRGSCITTENDLAETILNSPHHQKRDMSEKERSVADMQNICIQTHHREEMVSYIKPPVRDKNDCYNPCEDHLFMSTQQFSASLSQADIADYLSDNGNNFDQQASIVSTFRDEGAVPDLENNHIVPSEIHRSEYETDVTMYDDSSHFLMKEKEPAKVEPIAQPPSCFKWKYVPSVNIEDVPVNSSDSSYEEDTLLMVLPLKTCTRPIRVGLSKKYRARPLHNKYVK